MMSLAPSQLRYSEAQAERFFERVAEHARLVPGVKSAALTRFMPMDGLPPPVTIVPEGFQFPAGQGECDTRELDRGRALLRHDRAADSQGTRVPRDRFR